MTTTTARPAAMTTAPTLTVVPDDKPSFDVVPVIEQERDGVRHDVEVTLSDVEWRMLVGDFAAAIASRMGTGILPKLLAAGSRPSNVTQQRALDDLLVMLKGPTHRGSAHSLPPQWDLSPEDAGALALALAEASEDPVVCGCGAVVQQPTQLTSTCGGCVDQFGGDLR